MGSATLTVEGLDDIENSFRLLGKMAPKVAAEALTMAFQPVEQAMKINASGMFNKGFSKGRMVNSISHNVAIVDDWVGGMVGVFDMSEMTGDYGFISGRRVTAPMIAIFYETGIQSHFTSSGTRAARRATDRSGSREANFSEDFFNQNEKRSSRGKGEIKQHPGSPPIPFLSSAWDAQAPKMFDTIEEHLDKRIQEIL